MATVSPIDQEAIVAAAMETGAIVTCEEHSVHGGLGSAVAEVVVRHRPVPMRILGVPGVFRADGFGEFPVGRVRHVAGGDCRGGAGVDYDQGVAR